MLVLWQEYQAHTPDGLPSSQCCEAYRPWTGQLALVMRQSHRAGETLFVDSAGQTMPGVTALTGAVRDAALFIAVLGAANSTFAEATWSQSRPDWLGSHGRTFTALGGGPQVVVPDNLKAAVRRPHCYEPAINRTYAERAPPYDVASVPARAARPRDKAKVEVGVQVVERWRLARLRHHTCFSLQALHTAIPHLLVALNRRPGNKLPGARQSVCASLDRPALRPLPAQPYAEAEWQGSACTSIITWKATGTPMPCPTPSSSSRSRRVSVRRSSTSSTRAAAGPVTNGRPAGGAQPGAAHRPKAHQPYAAGTPQRLLLWAAKTGEATAQGGEAILTARPHPQQGFRACLGLMRLGKH